MSWSLQVRNGDLALSGASYGVVTGGNKLTQDLRCALLEHMGTDPSHPTFGSTIDGGMRSDGTYIPGVIGEGRSDLALIRIEAEIRRIVRDYQARQLERAKNDKLTYGKATLTGNEVLMNLVGISASQSLDTLNVKVQIQTARGTETIDIAVNNPTALTS